MVTPEISIVIPMYNEESTFPHLIKSLDKLTQSLKQSVEIVLVDDGSIDNTANLMTDLAYQNSMYHCVFLARNFGHQYAVSAGLSVVSCSEGAMVLDADLQDPPELLEEFYKNYKQGIDVSYGVRTIRNDEGYVKKITSSYFYKIQRKFANIDIPQNSGDFCFMSRRVIDVLNKMPEENRFIRGMRAWVGFQQKAVPYDRQERVAGETKYSMSKMIQLAMAGIFNFSELPIRSITILGFVVSLIAVAYFLYSLVKLLIGIPVEEGFLGVLFTIILFSGVQLISIGVIGEYILRIFFQVKQRPNFIVKNRIQNSKLI